MALSWLGESFLAEAKERLPFIECLSRFLLGVSANTGALSEQLFQLENLLRKLLFKDNYTLSIKTKGGVPDLKVVDTNRSGLKTFESPVLFKSRSSEFRNPGDIELKAVFENKNISLSNNSLHKANVIEFALFLQSFPELSSIFVFISNLIQTFCTVVPNATNRLNSSDLINDIIKLFPHFRTELNKLIELSESDIHVEHLESLECFKFDVSGPLNMKGLKEHYPSLKYSVDHFQEIKIKLLKFPEDGDNVDLADSKSVEEYCQIADYCYELEIVNKGKKNCFYSVKFCCQQNGRSLVWMNEQKNPTSLALKGSFIEFDLLTSQKVLVSIDLKIKVSELGCSTSIKLPQIIIKINYTPEKPGEESHDDDEAKKVDENNELDDFSYKPGFHLTILHIHKESYLTRILTAPFISLPLLRQLMEQKFFLHLSLHSQDEGQSENTPKVYADGSRYLALQCRALFLPPPMVLHSCLNLYVKSALKQNGDLHLYRDLTQGAAKDIQNILKLLADM